MSGWIETYRGSVAPWECDITEHFTIGYYLERIGEAEAGIGEVLGIADLRESALAARRLVLRFTRELRAGASYHIESAALGLEGALRLGHRIHDSATGEVVTWIEDLWEVTVPATIAARLAPDVAEWGGPAIERRPQPAGSGGFIPTARGRAVPEDLDDLGAFSAGAFVHAFTDALIQLMAAIGVDAAYMEKERRGFSTFELALDITGVLRLGEPYLVESGIAHLGNSSVRVIHRMSDPRSGKVLARLGQYGVNLDLDARRPAALPADIRARAQRLVIPAG